MVSNPADKLLTAVILEVDQNAINDLIVFEKDVFYLIREFSGQKFESKWIGTYAYDRKGVLFLFFIEATQKCL